MTASIPSRPGSRSTFQRSRKIAVLPALRLLAVAITGICLAGAAQQGEHTLRVEKKPRTISPGGGGKPFDVTRHLIPLHEIQGAGRHATVSQR